MRLSVIAATLAMMAAIPRANAGVFMDGNKLNEMCMTSAGSDYAMCGGYVMGTLDTIDSLQQSNTIARKLCPPSNLTGLQVAEMTRKHLKDNPQLWHHNSFSIIANLFVATFPCKKQ